MEECLGLTKDGEGDTSKNLKLKNTMRSDGGPIHHCSKQFQIADNLLGCLKGHTCNWNYITQQVFWDKGFEESLALNCTIKRCSPFKIESTTRHVWNSGSALPILGVFD